MTIKDVLVGLEYRRKALTKIIERLEKKEVYFIGESRDYEAKLDEIESIINWIKENKTP